MNIHFTDEKLKYQLDFSTIFKIEVGSSMYNLKTSNSDTDILCIYLEGSLNCTSITSNHHQFQYKDGENNIDYIYTSLNQFISNILSGDSTINYEVLQTLEFKEKFKDLWFFLNKINITNITKSYLGLSKRDLKSFKNLPLDKYNADTYKKISHFIRGVLVAEDINSVHNIIAYNHELLMQLKAGEIILSKDQILEYENKMNELRTNLKDYKFKASDIYNINTVIAKIYYENINKQLSFIDYGRLIEDAIYEDKFGY